MQYRSPEPDAHGFYILPRQTFRGAVGTGSKAGTYERLSPAEICAYKRLRHYENVDLGVRLTATAGRLCGTSPLGSTDAAIVQQIEDFLLQGVDFKFDHRESLFQPLRQVRLDIWIGRYVGVDPARARGGA